MPGGVAGAASVPNSCSLVAMYPSPGSAPGMKYAFGVPGSILNTVTAGRCTGLASVPSAPRMAARPGTCFRRLRRENPSM